jgi:hypothetical protein
MSGWRLLRAGFLVAVGAAVLLLERRRAARAYVEDAATHTGRNMVVAGIAAATVQALEAPAVVPLSRFVARRRWGLTRSIRPSWLRDLAAIVLPITRYMSGTSSCTTCRGSGDSIWPTT